MCYTPHHSKGNLVLSRKDGQHVLVWSERHIGMHASMASIIELDVDDTGGVVEKSGTGVHAEDKNGSRPSPGLLACAALCEFDLDGQIVHPLELCQNYQLSVGKPTWH